MSRLFGSSVTVSSFISPDKAAAEDPGAPGPRGPAGYRACASWGRVGPRGPGRPRESSAESCSSSHLCRLVCSKKKSVVVYRGHRVDPSDIFTWLDLSQEQTTPHLRLWPYRSDHTGTGSLLGFGCHAFATCLSSTWSGSTKATTAVYLSQSVILIYVRLIRALSDR